MGAVASRWARRTCTTRRRHTTLRALPAETVRTTKRLMEATATAAATELRRRRLLPLATQAALPTLKTRTGALVLRPRLLVRAGERVLSPLPPCLRTAWQGRLTGPAATSGWYPATPPLAGTEDKSTTLLGFGDASTNMNLSEKMRSSLPAASLGSSWRVHASPRSDTRSWCSRTWTWLIASRWSKQR